MGKEEGEEGINFGKFRVAEVECVFRELKKILSINENYTVENYTVGIITFYKLQEERIQKYVESLPYNQKKRVQAGTVDAFQGKEFDVVILSAVRCNNFKNLRTRTGFVSSVNRLCVAFSRAKRLLIVVGDFETIAKKNDTQYIKSFANFYDLCIKEGYFEQY